MSRSGLFDACLAQELQEIVKSVVKLCALKMLNLLAVVKSLPIFVS